MERMLNQIEVTSPRLLTWHKPEVTRLVLALSTGFRGESVEDGDGLGLVAVDFVIEG